MLFSKHFPSKLSYSFTATELLVGQRSLCDYYICLSLKNESKKVSRQTKTEFITNRLLVKDILQEGRIQRRKI